MLGSDILRAGLISLSLYFGFWVGCGHVDLTIRSYGLIQLVLLGVDCVCVGKYSFKWYCLLHCALSLICNRWEPQSLPTPKPSKYTWLWVTLTVLLS